MRTKTNLLFIALFLTVSAFSQTNEEIIKAFKNSYTHEKNGEYKSAADEIKQVYSDNSYEMNLRLGWLEYNAGLFDESVAHYNRSLKLKPYSEEAKFGLIYPKYAQGKFNEVISLYNKILEVNPASTKANYRLGLIYFGRKEYNKALKLFEKVLNLYPFDYDTLLMTAWTKYHLGKKNEAKLLFNKVLMCNPSDTSATEGIELIK